MKLKLGTPGDFFTLNQKTSIRRTLLSNCVLKFWTNLAAECAAAPVPSLPTPIPRIRVQSERSEVCKPWSYNFPTNILRIRTLIVRLASLTMPPGQRKKRELQSFQNDHQAPNWPISLRPYDFFETDFFRAYQSIPEHSQTPRKPNTPQLSWLPCNRTSKKSIFSTFPKLNMEC